MAATLERGDYVFFDGGQDAAGRPNFQRGMFGFFKVAGSRAKGSLLASAGSIAMSDFAFGMSLGRRFSGRGWVTIANKGAEIHELAVVKLNPGVSTRDGIETIHQRARGEEVPPPGQPTEVLGMIGAGKAARVDLDLEPGRYVAICLVPDKSSGKLHTELGMISPFKVRRRG